MLVGEEVLRTGCADGTDQQVGVLYTIIRVDGPWLYFADNPSVGYHQDNYHAVVYA